jgi:hypothetical protein
LVRDYFFGSCCASDTREIGVLTPPKLVLVLTGRRFGKMRPETRPWRVPLNFGA